MIYASTTFLYEGIHQFQLVDGTFLSSLASSIIHIDYNIVFLYKHVAKGAYCVYVFFGM